jgi:hypothetical protein
VLILPVFTPNGRLISGAYLALRLIEGGLMIAGGLVFLDGDTQYVRAFIYDNIHIWAFVGGGAAFYYLLYKTRAVPRFISVWGGAAIFVLLVKTVLNLAGIESQALDMFLVLIITNEFFLALWLMIKGLKLQTAEAARE